MLDAVEKGINVAEDDPNVDSVGYGGLPNAQGEVELDAGIMDGTARRAGAVCNLHKIKNPISVARLVMEKTRHTTMAGDGALQFAIAMGFEPMQLLTPKSLETWLKWKNTPNHETFWIDRNHHDTIGMVGIDGNGHVVAGCSTSGLAWKIPGRVARLAAGRLRLLRRRCCRRRFGNRQRRRDGELLHVYVHRPAHGTRRSSARGLRRSPALHGQERAEPPRRSILCHRDQSRRRDRGGINELKTIAQVCALAKRTAARSTTRRPFWDRRKLGVVAGFQRAESKRNLVSQIFRRCVRCSDTCRLLCSEKRRRFHQEQHTPIASVIWPPIRAIYRGKRLRRELVRQHDLDLFGGRRVESPHHNQRHILSQRVSV